MKIFKTKKAMKPRVLLDMDDVIVYFMERIIEDYNKDYKTNYTIEDCTKWEITDIFGNEILYYFNKEGICRNLEIKNNSDKFIKEIIESNRYDVFIVTACSPSSYLDRVEWVKEYMPYFNTERIIPAVEKSAIWADVLVDDNIYNVEEFNELIGTGIVYDMPHNRHTDEYKRINNLGELLPVLDEMFYPELNK